MLGTDLTSLPGCQREVRFIQGATVAGWSIGKADAEWSDGATDDGCTIGVHLHVRLQFEGELRVLARYLMMDGGQLVRGSPRTVAQLLDESLAREAAALLGPTCDLTLARISLAKGLDPQSERLLAEVDRLERDQDVTRSGLEALRCRVLEPLSAALASQQK